MRRAPMYLTLLVLLAGCAMGELFADDGDPVHVEPADIVGSWHSSAGARVIHFEVDGTFSAGQLPYEAFDEFVPDDFAPASDRLDGAGTWQLEKSGSDGSIMRLSFDQLAGEQRGPTGVELSILRQGDVVRLIFFYVGHGGNSWTSYEKCLEACPSPQPEPSHRADTDRE